MGQCWSKIGDSDSSAECRFKKKALGLLGPRNHDTIVIGDAVVEVDNHADSVCADFLSAISVHGGVVVVNVPIFAIVGLADSDVLAAGCKAAVGYYSFEIDGGEEQECEGLGIHGDNEML